MNFFSNLKRNVPLIHQFTGSKIEKKINGTQSLPITVREQQT